MNETKPAEKTAGPSKQNIPARNEIGSPEDAVFAYLREEISEDELRQYCARYSVIPGQLVSYKPVRPDDSFERKIPDDLLFPVGSAENPVEGQKPDTLESRQKAVDEKAKERERATKATEGETREETVKREATLLEDNLAGKSEKSNK
jgi:hypothetical protein